MKNLHALRKLIFKTWPKSGRIVGFNNIFFSQVTRQERAIHFDKFAIAY